MIDENNIDIRLVASLDSGKCSILQHFIQWNLDDSNTDGSFTLDDSKTFLSPYKILPIAQKQIYREIFLFYHEIVLCVYSLEPPYRCNSNDHTKHTIIV